VLLDSSVTPTTEVLVAVTELVGVTELLSVAELVGVNELPIGVDLAAVGWR
jgi:hypothetical protein